MQNSKKSEEIMRIKQEHYQLVSSQRNMEKMEMMNSQVKGERRERVRSGDYRPFNILE